LPTRSSLFPYTTLFRSSFVSSPRCMLSEIKPGFIFMKSFLILTLLTCWLSTTCWTQNDISSIIYTRQFTKLLESSGLEIRTDSLEHYILTDKTHPYLRNIDLYLVNPQANTELIVLVDENSRFPQMKFSGHVTNLMNNEKDHTVACYSLDEYFILTELGADWAADSQFIPKDQEEVLGYSRSFFNNDSGIQVTVILLASELHLLSTPREMMAMRFQEE